MNKKAVISLLLLLRRGPKPSAAAFLPVPPLRDCSDVRRPDPTAPADDGRATLLHPPLCVICVALWSHDACDVGRSAPAAAV